jgi:putative transposase
LQEALEYGKPEIFNTDQGCQFTSAEFIKVLEDAKIRISMDGKGRALDNIFVERLWRTVKYEDVYLKGYQNVLDAQNGLREYFDYYNMERRHSSLEHNTPWMIFSGLECNAPH